MSKFNNNNKSARNSSSKPQNSSSNTSKDIDTSDWNSLSNKWYSSLNPSKNIDKLGKKLSLEEYSVKIIGTRPPISCNVSSNNKNNNNHYHKRLVVCLKLPNGMYTKNCVLCHR